MTVGHRQNSCRITRFARQSLLCFDYAGVIPFFSLSNTFKYCRVQRGRESVDKRLSSKRGNETSRCFKFEALRTRQKSQRKPLIFAV